ncbi:MAG: glycosyltransferase [Pyrinomonadaceae bacterium]
MKIKVLNLISSPYGLGGAEKLLLDMAEFYDREKISVFYCNLFNSPQKNSLFTESVNEKQLPALNISGHRLRDIPLIISQLLNVVKNNKINILHTHLVHATTIGNIATMLKKKHRTIITQHYTRSSLNKRYLKKLDQSAVRKADCVIAISSAVKNDLLEQGVKENNIYIIPNGINLANFDRESEKKSKLLNDLSKQGKYVIGSVGNLSLLKDHLTLVRAMKKVVKILPEVHLLIIGEGPERRNLENLIKEYKLELNVTLLGFQADIPALIRNVDLYVHSSVTEAFGLAILEAMAARKCVIATEVDGVVDVVENNVSGFLIPSRDAQIMADYICQAIKNPQQTLEMGLKGRKRVEDNFRIETVTKKYQDLYEKIS